MRTNSLTRNCMCCRRICGFMLFIMVCITVASPAMAHRAIIFAWVQGEKIFTESKFSGGRLVKGGEVIVYDLEGNQLLKGKTDDKGEFSFEIPKKTSLKIVLIAGMGHRGEWTIPVSELGGAYKPNSDAAVSQKTGSKTPEMQAIKSTMSLEQIRRVVEQSLDQRLKPVMKILVESREHGPTFTDIFGGIGYILGLVGVAAYFNYRRKTDEIKGNKTG